MSRTTIEKSREDYLEAILVLIEKNGACRLTDIAEHLNYSKPSVSVAVKKLEEQEFIQRDDWRILLTEEGKELAEKTYKKHKFFTALFESIGIPDETAKEEACLMEHIICEDSFSKMVEHWSDELIEKGYEL